MSLAAHQNIKFWILNICFDFSSLRFPAGTKQQIFDADDINKTLFDLKKTNFKSKFACINQLISYGKITLWLTFKIRCYYNPARSLILFLDKSRGLNAGYSDDSGEQTDVAVVSLPQKLWPPFVWQNRGRIVEETLHRERLEEQFSIRV